MVKYKTKYVPVSQVQPGQAFEHHAQHYQRATDEEARRHPAVDPDRVGRIIYAYMCRVKQGGGRTPVSFVSSEKVIVRS